MLYLIIHKVNLNQVLPLIVILSQTKINNKMIMNRNQYSKSKKN